MRLTSYSPQGHKESDKTEHICMHTELNANFKMSDKKLDQSFILSKKLFINLYGTNKI